MTLTGKLAGVFLLAGAAAGLTLAVRAQTRPLPRPPARSPAPARERIGDQRPGPKLVPVAETRLLMEGLNEPNFRGLEKILKGKPAEAEAWTFARGQALLIGETGNLLMLRPPRSPAERTWLDRAGELRAGATQLARSLAAHDYERSRKDLVSLAGTCNACHQTFRVQTRITPFKEEDKDRGEKRGREEDKPPLEKPR